MENNLFIIMGLALVVVVALGAFFILGQPQEKWIEADGVKIQRISVNAEIIEKNTTKEKAVAQLMRENKLITFVGEAQGTGTLQEKEMAKIRAFSNLAEMLNARVSTFAQLVEGQLQSVSTSQNKQQIVSASVDAYKRVTELFAQARISGAYVYAYWRVKEGNIVKTYALLVYDPEDVKKYIQMQPEIDSAISSLSSLGVNFFGALNSVIEEAYKGTPLESKPSEPSKPTDQVQQPIQPTQPSQPSQPTQPISPTSPAQVNIPSNYIKGIGEAYGKTEIEAEESAKKNALSNLSEQLYVEVKSSAILKDQLSQLIVDNKVKEKFQSEYEKTIQTKTEFEFMDVVYKIVDKKAVEGKYYAKAEAYVDADVARQTFEAFVSIRLGNSLLASKMIYTAKRIVDKYEPILGKYKFPPRISEELSMIVGSIKNKYNQVSMMVNNVNSTKIVDKDSAIKVAQMINEIDAMAIDLPSELINRESLRSYLSDVKIELSGPSETIIGEQVTISVKVQPNTITLLRVIGENTENPDLISLKDGTTQLSGVVKSVNSKLTVTLAGIVSATWAPGKVSVNPDVLRVVTREGDTLRILAGGTAKIITDQNAMRKNATKDALIKIVKKAAAEVLIGENKELLNVPVDDYILDRVLAGIDYEITASGEYQNLYYVVVDAKISKSRFEKDIEYALKTAPSGFALLIVEGDENGYVESMMIERILSAGVKLVSKDFSKKILEEQYKLGYNSTIVARYAALSAARYLIYTKVNAPSTYLSEYKLYSVRMLVNTQIIDSITGNIVSAQNYEETNSGATIQAALSKIVNSSNFQAYIQKIINSLNFENVEISKAYRYTFTPERVAYSAMLLDALKAKYASLKVIENTDKKLVIEIDIDMSEMEKFFNSLTSVKVKKVSDYEYIVTK